ncbi:MAG: hypothetical protein F6J92_32370, partial [Symploca sp. SIO1A3]|nr:hypothetical protein [Symploca sp. SIO1A3]
MMSTGKELDSSLPTRSNYLNALPSYCSAALYPDHHSSHRQIIDYDGGLLAVEVEAILQQGLRKMSRHHVHLSSEMITARKVGARHGRPVILIVDAAGMQNDGYTFYCS